MKKIFFVLKRDIVFFLVFSMSFLVLEMLQWYSSVVATSAGSYSSFKDLWAKISVVISFPFDLLRYIINNNWLDILSLIGVVFNPIFWALVITLSVNGWINFVKSYSNLSKKIEERY